MKLQEQISRMKSMMGLEDSTLPLKIMRRVSQEDLDGLVNDVKDLIDNDYDKTDAIYDTVRQYVASNTMFKFPESSEQEYWDSYIEIEKPLVDYVKERLS